MNETAFWMGKPGDYRKPEPGDCREVWGATCTACGGRAFQMYALVENGTPDGELGWGPARCVNTDCKYGPRILTSIRVPDEQA